jgi:Uma2 family endonuclease
LRGYALAGVRECWIIRADTKAAEIYSNPQGDDYTSRSLVPFEGSLEIHGTSIPLKSIFPKPD